MIVHDPSSPPRHYRGSIHRWIIRILSLLVVVVWLLPLFWMVTASLRAPGTIPPRTITWIPDHPSFKSYTELSAVIPLRQLLTNSVLIVLVAVPITLITASWAGFAMSQLPSRVRRRWVLSTMLLLLVPGSALWLPRFILFTQIGLIDTFWVLVIPAFMGSSPLFVLLFYWTFRRIPHAIFEAGHLDGATWFQLWSSLGMPLARPTTIIVTVLTFTLYWGDFITPLLYLKAEHRYPMAVGLQMLQQLDRANWSQLMAGALIMCVPVVVGLMIIQRFFSLDSLPPPEG
jgi:multiple sugar transport system permease protein